MFLIEPPPTAGDLNFRVFGIPVRVHPMFWLVSLIMASSVRVPVFMLIWVGVVFVSILIHELGHAFAAKMHGWQPWITLYSFGGLASYRPTYRTPTSEIIIAAAGPGAGFLFIALIMAIVNASGHQVFIAPLGPIPYWFHFAPYNSVNLNEMLDDLLWINIFWGLMNLLPIFPLDGGRIAQELMQQNNPEDGLRQSLVLSMVVAGGVAVAGGTLFKSMYLALFFGYLAYTNYSMLQMLRGRGGPNPW
ncbi:MAG: site-2 protease family protein [Planctomycetia bacterium]|nr:site-2 protease family protein [Planctomycetia bacterium]